MRRTMWVMAAVGVVGVVSAVSAMVKPARAPLAATTNEPVAVPPVAEPVATPVATPARKAPAVQVALLLDTSGSMSGLIDQARGKLWDVVNELGRGRRDGAAPNLEIALYAYGYAGARDEIKLLQPFTNDLDLVSKHLFSLGTTGAFEPAPTVISRSLDELAWSADPDAVKLVFVAGNEEFDQGDVTPKAAMAKAAKKGVRVNVIHCGGDDPTWRTAATLAGTPFLAIDHNQAVAYVAAPQDQAIAQLNQELNGTYVPYGAQGGARAAEQKKQDANAQGLSFGSMLSRAATKSSARYDNRGWDLVDAEKNGTDVAKLEKDALPAEMRDLDEAGRKAYVAKKADERAALQKRISDLSEERRKFVATEQAKKGGPETLDSAMIRGVREVASTKGFRFE